MVEPDKLLFINKFEQGHSNPVVQNADRPSIPEDLPVLQPKVVLPRVDPGEVNTYANDVAFTPFPFQVVTPPYAEQVHRGNILPQHEFNSVYIPLLRLRRLLASFRSSCLSFFFFCFRNSRA